MIIKVCGMRDAANIRALDEANIADWMGFIYFPKSKRDVGTCPDTFPIHSRRVAVSVNAEHKDIIDRVQKYDYNLVQLHGDESPEYCNVLRKQIPSDVQIIKMIQISGLDDLNKANDYEGLVDYFLFETKCQGYGGSGQQFDWDILQHYNGDTPFILTGGIGADDADKVNAFSHPKFAGIDLNSKFEIEPALKDVELLKQFIAKLKMR